MPIGVRLATTVYIATTEASRHPTDLKSQGFAVADIIMSYECLNMFCTVHTLPAWE